MIDVVASPEMGWDEDGIYELYDEAASSFGDFSAEVTVRKLEEDESHLVVHRHDPNADQGLVGREAVAPPDPRGPID